MQNVSSNLFALWMYTNCSKNGIEIRNRKASKIYLFLSWNRCHHIFIPTIGPKFSCSFTWTLHISSVTKRSIEHLIARLSFMLSTIYSVRTRKRYALLSSASFYPACIIYHQSAPFLTRWFKCSWVFTFLYCSQSFARYGKFFSVLRVCVENVCNKENKSDFFRKNFIETPNIFKFSWATQSSVTVNTIYDHIQKLKFSFETAFYTEWIIEQDIAN